MDGREGKQAGEANRYARQERFLGAEAQRRIQASTVVIVGCGGLGCGIATLLARAGVGRLRIIDRDRVDLVNLHRQILFDEEDARAAVPKAVAAARTLARANSTIAIEPVVEEFGPESAARLCEGADVIVDGLDNFAGRYVLNDLAVKSGIPWVYGAAVGSYGLVMPVIPGRGPCLRCLQEREPPRESTPTCVTAGILGPLPLLIASVQSVEALKILVGREEGEAARLVAIDPWEGTVQSLEVRRNEACPCCGRRKFEFLDGGRSAAGESPPGPQGSSP